MATYWIIDAYNFIRTSRRFALLEAEAPEEGKQAALAWLQDFATLTGEKTWLVFDAYSRLAKERDESWQKGLKIIQSRGAYTADEEISELAKTYQDSAIVVSSDREVQQNAVRAGASILSSQEFEREVAKVLKSLRGERDFDERPSSKKGQAFRPPKEKKKAYQRFRKFF